MLVSLAFIMIYAVGGMSMAVVDGVADPSWKKGLPYLWVYFLLPHMAFFVAVLCVKRFRLNIRSLFWAFNSSLLFAVLPVIIPIASGVGMANFPFPYKIVPVFQILIAGLVYYVRANLLKGAHDFS